MLKNVVVNHQPASQSSGMGIQVLLICIAMLTLCQSTGCKLGIKEASMLTYRDTVWSKRAYNLRYAGCDREYSEHFQNGFCAGYKEMCNGGDGYVPALPPEEYRSPKYQSADGAKCVNSWFEGFPAGVAAARKDKSGTYHDVLISRMINSAIAQSKTQPVLPGDVKVVTPNRAQVDMSGNHPPMINPPSNNYRSPVNPLPSMLTPATFQLSPQAYTNPEKLPLMTPANFLPTPEFPAALNSVDTSSSDQRATDDGDPVLVAVDEVVDSSIAEQSEPTAKVTIVNGNQSSK